MVLQGGAHPAQIKDSVTSRYLSIDARYSFDAITSKLQEAVLLLGCWRWKMGVYDLP